MANAPHWLSQCRDNLGRFALPEVCASNAGSTCAAPIALAAVDVSPNAAQQAAQVVGRANSTAATQTGRAVASAVPSAVKQTTAEVVRGTIKGVGPIAAAFVAVESLHAVVRCSQGKITRKEAVQTSVCSAAGGIGSVGGATIGAVLGTALFPGIGTAVGGFIGSVLGGVGGRWGASIAMA